MLQSQPRPFPASHILIQVTNQETNKNKQIDRVVEHFNITFTEAK